MFMIIVDAHSKWLEVFPMRSITTTKTLEILRSLFATYGLPYQLVSDNGPQFISSEFEMCMKVNGIKHIKVAPYHPSSNVEAEHFVQTFKQAMRAAKNDEGVLQYKLAQFLLTYRSTPHSTTGVSPAELFLKRPLRTCFDLLRFSVESQVLIISLSCNLQRKDNPNKNSQAVKNGAALKSLGEKSCEIKGGSQEMAAMILMPINFNNAHSHY